jgi:hypothetical protein
MIRLIFAALLSCLPGVISAQELRVVSGNHSTFARLVILSRDLPDWTLGRVDDGYLLQFDIGQISFDLARVFDLIPQDRLSSVSDTSNGGLKLDVVCDCHVQAYKIAAGLVVDVRDGPAPVDSPFETSVLGSEKIENDAPAEITAAQIAFEQRPRTDALVTALLDRRSTHRTRLAWLDETMGQGDISPIVDDPDMVEEPSVEIDDNLGDPKSTDLRELRTAIVEEFGRASSQGLVDTALSGSDYEQFLNQGNESVIPVDPSLPTEEELENDVFAVNLDNLRLETAFDRGAAVQSVDPDLEQNGVSCPKESYFDVGAWGPKDEEIQEFDLPRIVLAQDSEEISVSAVFEIARRYVYFSFGSEAIAILDAYDIKGSEAQTIRLLANIIDARDTNKSILRPEHVGCENRVSMWAMIANPEVDTYTEVAREAVLLTFSELPLHLRKHIGPQLVERFLRINDKDGATKISQAISRVSTTDREALDLIQSELEIEDGDTANALERLNGIVSNDGPLAPTAAIRLIDETLDSGFDVPETLSTTVEALASESSGTQMGAELLRANLRAEAHAGKLAGALSSISEALGRDRLSASQAQELREEIYALAARASTDSEMIELFLLPDFEESHIGSDPDIINGLSERLIKVGLTSLARRTLTSSEMQDSERARELFAESHMVDGNHDLALAYVGDLQTENAFRIRAKALVALRREYAALAAYRELGDADAETALLKRLSKWDAVAETGDEAWQRAAAVAASGDGGREPELPGSLAQNEIALDNARTARSAMTELLDSVRIP